MAYSTPSATASSATPIVKKCLTCGHDKHWRNFAFDATTGKTHLTCSRCKAVL